MVMQIKLAAFDAHETLVQGTDNIFTFPFPDSQKKLFLSV